MGLERDDCFMMGGISEGATSALGIGIFFSSTLLSFFVFGICVCVCVQLFGRETYCYIRHADGVYYNVKAHTAANN